MKKISFIIFLALSAQFGLGQSFSKDYTRFVNVFIGTGSVDSLSLSGSNFPGACAPFGLVQLSPDTDDNPEDPCSGYDYADSTIVGFTHTHLNGTGVADLFDILFMPYGGKIKWEPGSDDRKTPGYRSAFEHESEHAFPGYYSVLLKDYKIQAELTATPHCGMQRYTFPDGKPYHLIVDMEHSLDKARPYWVCRIIGAQIRIPNNRTIEGYRIITGWARLRKVYFRAEFSRPFASAIFKDGKRIYKNVRIANGRRLKLVLTFPKGNAEPLIIKTGISSVSPEGARKNLKAEIKDFNFDAVVEQTKSQWNKLLSVVDISASDKTKRIFYTGLYHLFIQPNNIADVDGKYVDINGVERTAEDSAHYSTFSLWDTYRAAHPLYTILKPDIVPSLINSMLREYEGFGFLPIWQLWGEETYCMIGNHAVPVIVDAIKKGIKGFDYDIAYKAVKASLTTPHINSPFELLESYGYFPEDLQTQSVSIQLENAYDDWCAAELADYFGKKEDFDFFTRRWKLYKNLFDKKIGFFRGKDSHGNWIKPFSPLKYGGNGGYPFTEGNAWQYLWYVPEDVDGLISLLGGKQNFTRKLNKFFTLDVKPADVNGNASGFIGQYAHGNEPSHHIAYLYNFSAEPWRAQYYVKKIADEFYTDKPSGYAGNEDCGQMSAWYIFSAFGFYPINPADGKYYFGTPLLKHAEIRLPSGKRFEIITHNFGKGNIYLKKILLNGKEITRPFIKHGEITKGGKLEYFMDKHPNKKLFLNN